jgi:hypothetical protein
MGKKIYRTCMAWDFSKRDRCDGPIYRDGPRYCDRHRKAMQGELGEHSTEFPVIRISEWETIKEWPPKQ